MYFWGGHLFLYKICDYSTNIKGSLLQFTKKKPWIDIVHSSFPLWNFCWDDRFCYPWKYCVHFITWSRHMTCTWDVAAREKQTIYGAFISWSATLLWQQCKSAKKAIKVRKVIVTLRKVYVGFEIAWNGNCIHILRETSMLVIELKGFLVCWYSHIAKQSAKSFMKRKAENQKRVCFLLVLWKYTGKNMDERLQIHYVKCILVKLGHFGSNQIIELSPGWFSFDVYPETLVELHIRVSFSFH